MGPGMRGGFWKRGRAGPDEVAEARRDDARLRDAVARPVRPLGDATAPIPEVPRMDRPWTPFPPDRDLEGPAHRCPLCGLAFASDADLRGHALTGHAVSLPKGP
jgi:hypothetical protein